MKGSERSSTNTTMNTTTMNRITRNTRLAAALVCAAAGSAVPEKINKARSIRPPRPPSARQADMVFSLWINALRVWDERLFDGDYAPRP